MSQRLPRVYLCRHGQTEWSISGQHTGKTDIPLTPKGEEMIKSLGPRVVGPGKLLDPTHIQLALISPRQRAQRTFELLFDGSELPTHVTDPDVQEWDYGEYEGRKAGEIRKNSDPTWDIWVDGCPGGESSQEMSDRVDKVIKKVVEVHQGHHGAEDEREGNGDVLIVSHGHFTRCFVTRWCKLSLDQGRIFVCDVGALTIGGYQHENFDERSLLGVNLFGEV